MVVASGFLELEDLRCSTEVDGKGYKVIVSLLIVGNRCRYELGGLSLTWVNKSSFEEAFRKEPRRNGEIFTT